MKTFQIIFSLVLCAFVDNIFAALKSGRLYSKALSVSNGGPWGSWEYEDFCPRGSYAIGFAMKVRFHTPPSPFYLFLYTLKHINY